VKALASPAGLAIVALLLAAAAHPGVDFTALGTVGPFALPLLALLFALAAGLAVRGAGVPAALVAAGVALAVAAVGYDALRGRSGQLTLRPGEGTSTFAEEAPGGAVLGLRPLGFELQLSKASPESATLAVTTPTRTSPVVPIGPREPLAEGDLRLGWRAYEASPRLALSVSSGDDRVEVDLSDSAPAQVEDATIRVVRYFPDFAIAGRDEPYSKSSEYRNPGALLQVSRGGRTWPVFVLRALSGPQEINEIREFGWTFGLTSMTPDPRLTLGVHREPAALVAALGVALAAVGLALGLRR
jgi:hypothetical protein